MPYLSEADGRKLLELARKALVEIVTRREFPDSIPHEGIFGERRGVFVTLHVGSELRGCIGTTEGDEPLGAAVVRCAAGAALHDPRFAAVRAEELERLRIEISVLSPVAPIGVEEIEIGTHGLVGIAGCCCRRWQWSMS
jgi:AmmeMemoRadiSam system protein A